MPLGLLAQRGEASIFWPAGVLTCPSSAILRTYSSWPPVLVSSATAFFRSSVRTMSRAMPVRSTGSSSRRSISALRAASAVPGSARIAARSAVGFSATSRAFVGRMPSDSAASVIAWPRTEVALLRDT